MIDIHNSSSRIFPNWEQISQLKSPLTDGELALLKFLDTHLPPKWEIYNQPFLNGDRPDIVILHPEIGIMIFEVKDWNLVLYTTEETEYFDPKTKKTIKYYQSYVLDKNHERQKIINPIKQVERYRDNLFQYLPQLANAIDENYKRLSALKVALYLHNATTYQAQEFIPMHDKQHCIIFGRDDLNINNIRNIVPDYNREKSAFINNYWAQEIRFWLMPPYHAIEQGQKIILSSEQKRHIDTAPHQHQRLRGVAGSGKTLVIAQRAANLAFNGKKILVVTYNITLWHFIRDAISRARYGFSWELIEFNHIHGFCKNYLYENDIPFPTLEGSKNQFLDDIVPELVIASMKRGKNEKNRQYDAILIDEGQDFTKKYYDMLQLFLTENDEVFLVADERQNIYSRELAWLQNMQGTKFKGRWRELKESYRLPIPILHEANRFAENFLPETDFIPEPFNKQSEFQLSSERIFLPHLLWRNIETSQLPLERTYKAFEWLTKKHGIHPSEIVIMLPTHKEGVRMKQYFVNKNIGVNDVFEEEKGDKRHKQSFWMGDSRLKMSTIHSFKGWELTNVILVTPDNDEYPAIDELMYIAITRTRENLIIFNRLSKYEEYGKIWPNKW